MSLIHVNLLAIAESMYISVCLSMSITTFSKTNLFVTGSIVNWVYTYFGSGMYFPIVHLKLKTVKEQKPNKLGIIDV